jgi:hypothetical protein
VLKFDLGRSVAAGYSSPALRRSNKAGRSFYTIGGRSSALSNSALRSHDPSYRPDHSFYSADTSSSATHARFSGVPASFNSAERLVLWCLRTAPSGIWIALVLSPINFLQSSRMVLRPRRAVLQYLRAVLRQLPAVLTVFCPPFSGICAPISTIGALFSPPVAPSNRICAQRSDPDALFKLAGAQFKLTRAPRSRPHDSPNDPDASINTIHERLTPALLRQNTSPSLHSG